MRKSQRISSWRMWHIRWALAKGGLEMQGLTWAARTHSIMVFIWRKLPKWVFSLAYINKTVAL